MTKPRYHAIVSRKNAETVAIAAGWSGGISAVWVGLYETAACRLITQRSAVRIRPRYQESGPQDIVLGATFVVHVASF